MKPIELLKNLLNLGLTQHFIADRLGIPQSSVSMYANGKRKKIDWELGLKIIALHDSIALKAHDE